MYLSTENLSKASFLALAPIADLSCCCILKTYFITSHNFLASYGSIKNPVIPSLTISDGPPTSVTIDGSPQSIASTKAIENPSENDGCTNASDRMRNGITELL